MDGIAVHQTLSIPLGRCAKCKNLIRILPIDLLPSKTFGLAVIEHAIDRYLSDKYSYRSAVCGIVSPEQHCPSPSTLYRWITGLSEKLLERTPEISEYYFPAATAAIAQTERTLSANVSEQFLHGTVTINPCKYRSEHRHDQLRAVSKLLLVAVALFAVLHSCLIKWNLLLLPMFYVPVWNFPTGKTRTPMQRAQSP